MNGNNYLFMAHVGAVATRIKECGFTNCECIVTPSTGEVFVWQNELPQLCMWDDDLKSITLNHTCGNISLRVDIALEGPVYYSARNEIGLSDAGIMTWKNCKSICNWTLRDWS
jgi:hypothetical protein